MLSMRMKYRLLARFAGLGMIWLALVMSACNSDSQDTASHPPVEITTGDECHLCGMYINKFPGPKGEAYVRGNRQALKFCSTRDLFAYVLQPDVQTIVREIYVHDMGKTDWQKPATQADYFTNARTAWYVVDSPVKGAMGHTLASFARKQDAENFIRQHGGRLLRFEDITLEVISDVQKKSHLEHE